MFNDYGICCRKPGDMTESQNFYNIMPDQMQQMNMYQVNKVPFIDDPLNPHNNVGKSTF